MKLTKDQKAFLKEFDISLDEVFDAQYYSSSEWKSFVKNSHYKVVVGVTPCKNYGHVMRTRGGHCAICNPRNLRFQARHSDDNEIYVMYSPSTGLTKVGIADCAYTRQDSLNAMGYGTISDWKVIFCSRIAFAGKIEHFVYLKFKKYHYPIQHDLENSSVATEIYNCPYEKIIKFIEEVINKANLKRKMVVKKIAPLKVVAKTVVAKKVVAKR
jgi:hypothetical protein